MLAALAVDIVLEDLMVLGCEIGKQLLAIFRAILEVKLLDFVENAVDQRDLRVILSLLLSCLLVFHHLRFIFL